MITVGPVILSIPSYFTFTIANRTNIQNMTISSNDELLQEALNKNVSGIWQNEDNETWTMEANFTKYYMFYSDLAQENDRLLFR